MTQKESSGLLLITLKIYHKTTNEVSLKIKIKEAILAFRIERAYSKERILELYLNQIYLGQGTYGIAAASLEYFDKSIKELNYPDSALLAALPKAPSKYNPYKFPKVGKFRRNLVLQNLKDNNFISENELEKYKKTSLNLKKRKIETSINSLDFQSQK